MDNQTQWLIYAGVFIICFLLFRNRTSKVVNPISESQKSTLSKKEAINERVKRFFSRIQKPNQESKISEIIENDNNIETTQDFVEEVEEEVEGLESSFEEHETLVQQLIDEQMDRVNLNRQLHEEQDIEEANRAFFDEETTENSNQKKAQSSIASTDLVEEVDDEEEAFYLSFANLAPKMPTPSTKGEIAEVSFVGLEKRIIKWIEKATTTLDVAIYSITSALIVSRLVEAKNRGVTVRLITDRIQSKGPYQKKKIALLKNAGIPIRMNKNPNELMHLKLMIVDSETIVTGSYNYTSGGNSRNDELLLVLNHPKIVEACRNQFRYIWNDQKSFFSWKGN